MRNLIFTILLTLLASGICEAQVNSVINKNIKSEVIDQSGLIVNDLNLAQVLNTPLIFKYRLPSNQKLITSFKIEKLPKPGNYNYLNNPYGVPSITINTKSNIIGKIKLPFNNLF